MNREIKFRVWDDKKKRYIKNPIRFHQRAKGLFYMFGSVHIQEKYLIHEQYTGLKDKFNREIWEGDLIVFDYEEGGREPCSPSSQMKSEVMEVYWCDSNHGFRIRTGKIYQSGGQFDRSLPYQEDIELVGNKNENPEMLEFKKIRLIKMY